MTHDSKHSLSSDTQSLRHEPIAIIGMGCRFPGGVNTPKEFWHLLCEGVDAISEVPQSRWDSTSYQGVLPNYGGFLQDVDQFDASFFQISPKEAIALDPQQRLLLEVSWEALEDAGINPENLRGTESGVFVGIFSNDYQRMQVKQTSYEDLHLYLKTGTSAATASGRISYFLGLQGPAISVDTASSSSLVAFHLACQSLWSGECELALAAGVNLILSPDLGIAFTKAGMLSPDGRSKGFDVSANGYVRGEGCGVVVLKPLSSALRDQNQILAVVRGSAINQDGASSGLTVPNESAQKALIRKALLMAGLEPHDVSYIEAHGSGTPVGDPIEGNALQAIYGEGRTSPWVIGSVKTNIGHLEAAAGIAGIIKTVLALQYAYIPPHLHFERLNPNLASLQATIPVNGMEWQTNGTSPRRAGVSSFGFSGTNAHVILEEVRKELRIAHPQDSRELQIAGNSQDRPYHLLALSAKEEQALVELAERYDAYLGAHPDVDLAALCATANRGRTHFDHRLAAVAQSPTELRKQLRAFATGETCVGLVSGVVMETPPKIAFLFTGQGSQHVGMGYQLYETESVFRQSIDHCDKILRPIMDLSLLDVLYPTNEEESKIDQTAYTQPALFAIEYALTELWKSWGIEPDVVMGHSVGEIVAACVAGVFSLEDGLRLIAKRGELMQRLPDCGEMVALLAEPTQVLAAMAPYTDQISLAVLNGPQNVVISGTQLAVQAVVSALPGIRATQLQVSHAFHSPLMDPILDEFEQFIQQLSFSTPRIDFISNMTGKIAQESVATAGYWTRHIRESVRFVDGMQALHEQAVTNFVEIGPKPILLSMGRRCLSSYVGEWHPTLQPEQDDLQSMLQSLGELYLSGVPIAFNTLCGTPKRLDLPTYPFQRQRYWGVSAPEHSFPTQQNGHHGSSEYLHSSPIYEESTHSPRFNKLGTNRTDSSRAVISGMPTEETSLPTQSASPATSVLPLVSDNIRQQLVAGSSTERIKILTHYVQTQVSEILGLRWNVPQGRSLRELGLDSLMGTELSQRFSSDLAVMIPTERLIGGRNSVNSLTDILLDKLVLPDTAQTNGSGRADPFPLDATARDESNPDDADFNDVSAEVPQIHAIVTAQEGRKLRVEGKEGWVYDFASCNYLGLDLHPAVMDAIMPAIQKWGVHPSWTRAVASPAIYDELEQELADLVGAPDVLVFPAITLLHAGVMPLLAGYDGVIFKDIAAHRSVYEGCLLAQANGATFIDFKHNDVADLEEKLARYPYEKTKLIAIDGVYSMSGAYPPLPDFARLAKEYNAWVYMDDAHGIGIIGEHPTPEMPYGTRGNGIVKHFGLDYEQDRMIYVSGLSKSYSSFGAFITCFDKATKIHYKSASTFIFSGPSPVASLASAIAGLKLNRREGDEWRKQVYKLTYKLVTEAKAMGFDVINDNYFPIVGVVIGKTRVVVEACKILWKYGILITPALFPIVPMDQGRLRFSITAANTEEEIDRALEALREVKDRL